MTLNNYKKYMIFQINQKYKKPNKSDVLEFQNISVSMISDSMGNLNTMDSGINMMFKDKKVCGPAITVTTRTGDFLSVLKALEISTKGDVLVIDSNSSPDTANWGEITTMEAKIRKLAGVVIDGFIRDYKEISEMNFSVFARGTSPRVANRNNLGEVNVSINCGGAVVNAGDLVVGDSDGVIVIPKNKVKEVLKQTKILLKYEEKLKKYINEGGNQVDYFKLDKLRNNLLTNYNKL